MSRLTTTISHYWDKIQGSLFPQLVEELDPLTEKIGLGSVPKRSFDVLCFAKIQQMFLWQGRF